jgi:hypothetical protein
MKNKTNQKSKIKSIIITFAIAILCLCGVLFYNYFEKEFHTHADFKVYVNNSFINFSQDKYQSTQFNTLHNFVHLHDGEGEVIHYHEKGIKLEDFFNSINITFSNNCFIDDKLNSYCNNDTHKINTYVNKELIKNAPQYISKDLGQILIVYESKETNIENILNQVTDKACIQSAICPERGEPSEGSCITGQVCQIDMTQFE